MNNLKITNDDLEEQGLVECCMHCNSMDIRIEGINLYCKDCGSTNFTQIVTEKEYEEMMKLKI